MVCAREWGWAAEPPPGEARRPAPAGRGGAARRAARGSAVGSDAAGGRRRGEAGEGRAAPQGRRPEKQRSRAAGDYMRGASSLSRAHRALVPRSLLRSSSMVMRRLFSRVSSMSFLISARTGVWYSSTAFS